MKYLSLMQVAARYSVSRSTIDRWRTNPAFPAPVQLSDRVIRWRDSDLDAYDQSLIEEKTAA